MFYYFQAMNDPQNATSYIKPMLKYFVVQIPGILAGDISAAILAAITDI